MTPLFGDGERLQADTAQGVTQPDPGAHLFFHVDAPDERLDTLTGELLKHDAVEAAYVKPAASPRLPLSLMSKFA